MIACTVAFFVASIHLGQRLDFVAELSQDSLKDV